MRKDALALSVRDRSALYAVAVYKFLSSFQLAYLYFSDSTHSHASRRLTTLAKHGYLSRVFSYPKATDDHKGGHPTAVYFWTPDNKKNLQLYLENRGLAELFADFEPLVPTDDNSYGKSQLFLVHELGISDFFLSLEEAVERERWNLLFWERTSPISKEVRALIPPLKVTITRTKNGVSTTTTEIRPFNPDAIFLLEDSTGKKHFGFLEYDNNTASPEKFNKKLEGYIKYHQSKDFGTFLDYYASKYSLSVKNIDFRVFAVCANVRGDHRRRDDLFLASLPYKQPTLGRTFQLGEGWHSSENAVRFWNP